MVAIRPFNALHYEGIAPDKMGDVTSPPYDVFTSEMQRSYHARHPNNVVRLIQGEILPGEDGDAGRIARAVNHVAKWKEQGVLAADAEPALYPYVQSFTLPDGTRLERRSFFAAIRVEEYGKGQIHPHEQTFPKPKGYLFDLWGKAGAHLGPIFGFYDDPDDAAMRALARSMEAAPFADFEDDGVRHTLWRCGAPAAVRAAQGALAAREVFIADGHHRYETSLNLRDAARKAGAREDGEADYTLMCLANANDPGMVVLPTHRLLKKVSVPAGEALDRIVKDYEVLEVPDPGPGRGGEAAQRLRALADERGRAAFCLFDGRGPLRFLVRKQAAVSAGVSVEQAVAALDVSLLHAEIVDGAFGASHEEGDIGFTPDPELALAAARKRECQAALLLNPTPIEAVCRIAKAGGKMPHKSTYFYPKLRTGLVVHAFAPPALG